MEIKLNSLKPVLKQFFFSENKMLWLWNVLAVLANQSPSAVCTPSQRLGAERWCVRIPSVIG